MRHTQEQLATLLNNQRKRGIEDALLKRAYGHTDESISYPNPAWPDHETDTCDNCSKPFNEGDGISGFDEDGNRKSYDWDCAIARNAEVDDYGNLHYGPVSLCQAGCSEYEAK